MTTKRQVLVIILQCETKPCDTNIATISKCFSDPYFQVQVCAVETPGNINNLENYYLRKALTYAAEGPYTKELTPLKQWSHLPCLIIKDSSISNISDPKIMKLRVQTAIDTVQQADLFFLCKWNDTCDKYTDVSSDKQLKWTLQPTATQAILFRPNGRDLIKTELETSTLAAADVINSQIVKKKVMATVFVPNIIDFDIDLATSAADYYKLNECAVQTTATTNSTSSSAIIWFFVLLFIILLVAWTMIQI